MDYSSQIIVIATAIGIASGSIGPFVLLEHLALAGDALSHVALPGIALALAYSIDPFWGVLASLILAAYVVWAIRAKTKLPGDALIGVLFTASLAIGILTIPNQDIIDSLFGEFPALTGVEFILVVGTAVALSMLIFLLARRFTFLNLSRELADVHKIGQKTELVFLLIFAIVVALGIKLVGTLLMGALTIIPALAARNISRSMRGYLLISAALGGIIGVFGIIIANYWNFLPGPTIVLFGIACFAASLLFRK
ncbi:MAG: metal ABC transporter permease [Patescibacteria group bacterium]